MMNADKQVLYSGVPQEDWQKNSKYPRIMSNGPKPPKSPEKSRRISGLIPFMILTGVTLLISAGVVIGLHYIKYTEKDGLVFSTGGNNKASEESKLSGTKILVPKPHPIDNKNPAEPENPNTPQNPNDKALDQGKEASSKVEPLEKDSNAQVNPSKPEDGKDHISTTDDGNKNIESNSNTNINSEKNKDENLAETEKQQQQQQQPPEGKDITNDNIKVPVDTAAVDGKQNAEDIPLNNQGNMTDDEDDDGDDDWFDIIKTDGDIIFQKPTTTTTTTTPKPKPKEIKETDAENQPIKKEEKEEKESDKKERKEKEEKGEKDESVKKDLDKKDNDMSQSKEKEEHKEDNKTEEEEEDKKEDKDHEDTSLLYKAINNFAQKYFNSTNLNPTQVKDMLQNLSVGPSLEVIIIAAGIIFIGLSLLIIAITCLVTRTRKVKIRREKIKKAVSDLEGAEKIILLTDEQSEDEYVKA